MLSDHDAAEFSVEYLKAHPGLHTVSKIRNFMYFTRGQGVSDKRLLGILRREARRGNLREHSGVPNIRSNSFEWVDSAAVPPPPPVPDQPAAPPVAALPSLEAVEALLRATNNLLAVLNNRFERDEAARLADAAARREEAESRNTLAYAVDTLARTMESRRRRRNVVPEANGQVASPKPVS